MVPQVSIAAALPTRVTSVRLYQPALSAEATDLKVFQEVSHIVLLQALVGIVDAQLLQAVEGEDLKTVDVQQTCHGTTLQ